MTIRAKFPGRCTACGGPIRQGDLIAWARGAGAQHVKCAANQAPQAPAKLPAGVKPPTGPVFLNSAPIRTPESSRLSDEQAAEILAREGREFVRPLPAGSPTIGIGYKVRIDGRDLEIGTCGRWVGIATDWPSAEERAAGREAIDHAISLVDGSVLESSKFGVRGMISKWTRRLGAPDSLERNGKNSVRLGEIFRRSDGSAWLVTAVDKSYYLSDDDAEELDMFDRGGGWATPFECREVSRSAAEREKDAAKAETAANAKTAEEAKERHISSICTPPPGWVMVDGVAQASSVSITSETTSETVKSEHFDEQPLTVPEKSAWTLLDQEVETDGLQRYARLYQAGPIRVLEHGNWDDWRQAVMLPPEVADSYLTQEVARLGITPEAAREWLRKYSGCVGTAIYEHAARKKEEAS